MFLVAMMTGLSIVAEETESTTLKRPRIEIIDSQDGIAKFVLFYFLKIVFQKYFFFEYVHTDTHAY